MSSWKDSSDFASLSAALLKAKPQKSREIVDKAKSCNEIEEALTPSLEGSVSPVVNYSDFCENDMRVPTKDTFLLKQHKSTVSVLEFESSGSRFLSGSHDTTVAYWDFNGMVRDQAEPFRFIEPMGSYTIRSLKFSKDSQWVLMAASSWCCKLFDRNGSQIREYGKGDPYIRDLKHTTGHVAGISTAIWVPNDPDRFLTASEDGTMRIWHIGYRQKSELVIPVKSSVSGTGGRSAISAAVFSNDYLLTGSVDGSIKLWDSSALMSAGSVPMGTVSDAHLKGEKITCFAVSHANPDSFASRSTDGTVKLWDRRNFKCPVQTFCDLPTMHSETSLVFAAKDARLLTGTATGIAVLDPLNSTTRTIIPSASAIVSLAWNERTEQLLAGSTAGTIQVHFDPEMGNGKGVLLMRKSASAARIDGEVDISADSLYNNSCGGIGQFDSVASASRAPSKRKLDKIRSDPIKSHRPEMPSFGPGQGGRIGSNVTQTIMKSVLKDTTRDVDPRAALLSYAERAAKNPKFVATAYQETQPDPLLDPSLLDKEVAIEEEKQRKLDEMERLKADKEKINARFK